MQPDIVIVRTYRSSDGLSRIPDDHNTLTLQSADTKDDPRDPLHAPITTSVICINSDENKNITGNAS